MHFVSLSLLTRDEMYAFIVSTRSFCNLVEQLTPAHSHTQVIEKAMV